MTNDHLDALVAASSDPLLQMIAHSLQTSGAPRFLLALLVLPAGEHRVLVDHHEVMDADREAVLVVTGEADERDASLSFASNMPSASGAIMPTVWHHYRVQGGVLREAKTFEESPPDQWDIETELAPLATGSWEVEDLAEALGLRLERGPEAPTPR